MGKVGSITIPVDIEPGEKLKALIAAEVARQLADIRNLPLDELTKAIGEKLAQRIRLHGGMRSSCKSP